MKKIKVLNIITDMNNGGAQKIVLNYLEDLSDDDIVDFKVLVINSGNRNSYCYKKIKQENYNVVFLDPFKIKIPYLRRYVNKYLEKRAVNKYLRKNKVDIVHVHISALLDIVLDPIVNNNIPIRLDTLHSNPYRFKGKKLSSIRRAFQKENFIPICITEEQAEMAKKQYGFKNYEIVRNGTDFESIRNSIISKEDARKKFDFLMNSFIILGVGRLDLVKRFDLLINIFNEVSKKNENALLVLAGDGPEKSNLQNQVRKLNLDDKVIFLGHIDNITPVYCAADVLAMTSLTEASPLTLIEAQICKLRCVVSNGVPSETIITNNVEKLGADSTIDDWSKALMNKDFVGKKVCDESDYEVHNQSLMMKDVYIKYYNEYEKNISSRWY